MRLIKTKVSFTIVEDVKAQEEYFDITNEEKAKRMQDTNFLQKHLKEYEEEIKEAFTFSSNSRNKKIDFEWVENLKIELSEVEE
mgnify:FL=1